MLGGGKRPGGKRHGGHNTMGAEDLGGKRPRGQNIGGGRAKEQGAKDLELPILPIGSLYIKVILQGGQ